MRSIPGIVLIFFWFNVSPGQDMPVQFDQPVRAEQYIIRPGDELTVTFLKANIEPLKLVVDPEGRIIHNQLGLYNLSHRTLSQAREELTGALKNLFKVEDIIISISNPLAVRFSVIGAVAFPGTYDGFNSQRVSDAIKLAGGILSEGSTRGVIFSGGPKELVVDLDLAAYSGNVESNPCLYAGYSIQVPPKSKSRVEIIGEVNYPREIELLPNDDLERLILLAGGLRNWADANNIEIIRNGNLLDARTEKIQAGDIIKANALADIADYERLSIFGAVTKPGKFTVKGYATLDTLVLRAGGFADRAVKQRTTVFRFNPVDAFGRISMQRFPIQNVFSTGMSRNEFKLEPGDSVFVPFAVGYVEVAGLVKYPGSFPYQTDKSAEYYINLAGGYLPEADRTRIQIYDLISQTTSELSPKVNVYDGSKIIVIIRKELE